MPSGECLGKALEGRGGISNRISKPQEGDIHRRYAHVAHAPTRHHVGLDESEAFLAAAGRGNRRRGGRQLEMMQVRLAELLGKKSR